MTKVLTDQQNYTDIANAIRNKNGTTTTYKPNQMASAINAINNQAILNTPAISLSDSILTLTNPSTNGNFATGFNIYNGSTLLSTQLIDITTLDLSTILIDVGTYIITAKCYGDNMKTSNASNSTSYIILPPQLAKPTNLSLSGSMLSWNVVPNATSYDVYSENSLIANVTTNIIDLSNYITEDGTYAITIKAKADGYTTSEASDSINYVIGALIYGVSGLYQSAPVLTRTDNAVGMTYSINSTTGEITSDFSNVFPYNQMTRETINGNVFVNVPSMWWRITTDSSKRITAVAVSNAQGSGDNWYQSRAFKYGAYGGSVSGDVLKSVSGVARQVRLTRANARTYAMANGTGYHQRDLYSYTILMFLWYIEFATKDSASIMYGANPNKVNTGGTDNLGFSTGYNPSTNQMIWHNIEDFIGNVLEWEDGTTTNGTSGSTQYVSADYTKYNDTGSGMNTLAFNSLSSFDWLTALGWDNNNPFLVQPIENSGGSESTYFCDKADEGSYVVSNRGTLWTVNSDRGLSYFLRAGASLSNDNVGCRLCYTPT